MVSYDYCKQCGVNRFVEGWNKWEDYIQAGWIRLYHEHRDKDGTYNVIVEWVCPDCNMIAPWKRDTVSHMSGVGKEEYQDNRRGD